MVVVGFWAMGWTTAGSAERMARSRAETAAVMALVPFCVDKAKRDTDTTRMTKFQATTSSYERSQLVKANGWAALAGAAEPDHQLTQACSDKLHAAS